MSDESNAAVMFGARHVDLRVAVTRGQIIVTLNDCLAPDWESALYRFPVGVSALQMYQLRCQQVVERNPDMDMEEVHRLVCRRWWDEVRS